jgi:hypothetical protein
MRSELIVIYDFPEVPFLLTRLNRALVSNNAEKINRLVASSFANKKLAASDFKLLLERIIKKLEMDRLADQKIGIGLLKALEIFGKTKIQVVVLKALEEAFKLMEGIRIGPFNQVAPF